MVGVAAGGAGRATVAIVIRATDMASKIFQRVSRSAGGLSGTFKTLGLGVSRLLGPLGGMSLALQVLIPLVGAVAVGLSTRKWLQHRDALGRVRFQLTLLGRSHSEANDMINLINNSLDRSTAISLFNNKRAMTTLSKIIDEDLIVSILKLSQKMTDAHPSIENWTELISLAATGLKDPLIVALAGVGTELEGIESAEDIFARMNTSLEELDPSNVAELAKSYQAIDESLVNILGPIGEVTAALNRPLALALSNILIGIDNVRLSLGAAFTVPALLVAFLFDLSLVVVNMGTIEDAVGSLQTRWNDFWADVGANNDKFFKKIKENFQRLGPIWDGVMTFLLDEWDKTWEAVTTAWEGHRATWDTLWEFMKDPVQNFLDWVTPLWEGFVNSLSDPLGLLGTIRSALTDPSTGQLSLANLLPDWAEFQRGGVVPGPIGAPVPAIVHGGERIIPVGSGGGGGGTVIVPLSIGGNMLGELIINTIHRTAKFESGIVTGAIGGGTSGLR